jgi:hypothetical protein
MRPGREIFISALRGEADDTLVQAFGVGPGWGLWRAVQLALEGLDIGSQQREIFDQRIVEDQRADWDSSFDFRSTYTPVCVWQRALVLLTKSRPHQHRYRASLSIRRTGGDPPSFAGVPDESHHVRWIGGNPIRRPLPL